LGTRNSAIMMACAGLLFGIAAANATDDAAQRTWPAVLTDGRTVAVGVVDGDSITVEGREWRLLGYDTAEIGSAGCEGERRLGILAQRRLAELIAVATERRVEGGATTDRHRRPLGDLVLDGRQARDLMLAELHGRPYNGGRKKGWCSRDSRDDLIPGPLPAREARRGG
jgi:micrococcal nuclease